MKMIQKSEMCQNFRNRQYYKKPKPFLRTKTKSCNGTCSRKKPQAFLMDEPLSNLDAKLRVQMRAELGQLHFNFKLQLYVTHDQVEAMTMGDRVAVIRKGVLQQIDTPREFIYILKIFLLFQGSPSTICLCNCFTFRKIFQNQIGDVEIKTSTAPKTLAEF